MSVEAVVETEYGERLLLWHTDGTPGGKPIASFLGALDLYCLGSNKFEDVRHWFARLESVLGGSNRRRLRTFLGSEPGQTIKRGGIQANTTTVSKHVGTGGGNVAYGNYPGGFTSES